VYRRIFAAMLLGGLAQRFEAACMAKRGKIHIGTSGWSYEHWLGSFYEKGEKPKDYLAAYSQHFNTAEVNNTFYRLPSQEAVRQWRETVPKDFIFAVKASRFMTHMKKLKDPEEPIERMLGVVGELGDKLGPILVQCPPNWKKNTERLGHFLEAFPDGYRLAFEFRDPSWFDQDVYDLLSEHGAALCIYDLEGEVSPVELTAPWIYVRFHKPAGENNWRYSQDVLAKWADAFDSWSRAGNTVYCYFNNDLDGAAPENAHQMLDLIDERGG
jgi:uncharacterized protein YecE (DUF72 family)